MSNLMLEDDVLRAKARKDLEGGIFKHKWLLMLAVCLVYELCITASTYSLVGELLMAGALTYGLMRVSMNIVRGKEVKFEDLFSGFSESFWDSFKLNFMLGLFLLLWSLLFVIPGYIKQYSYAMAPYIQQRSENKDWRHAMNESKRLMDGYKAKLFCLDLSFIGWYILGIVTLGIGLLFVIPYHMTARAEFYETRLAMEETPVAMDEDATIIE